MGRLNQRVGEPCCLFTQRSFLEEPASLFPLENVPSPPPRGVVGTANPRVVTLFKPQAWHLSVYRERPRSRHIAQGRPSQAPLLEFYIQTIVYIQTPVPALRDE